ncbi:MAG: hypothetical protein JWR34_7416 [Mycobacterium sp.]|nr:hypothetical protein [Mycobacterium sp.]
MTAFGMGFQAAPKEFTYGSTLAEESPDGQLGQYVGRLLTFIPGDVVAGYTAVFVWIPAELIAGKWALVIFCVVVSSVLVLAGFIPSARKMGTLSVRTLPWFRIVAAPLAFATWVIALPNSPFDSVYGAPWFKTAVLIFGSGLLAAFAPVFEDA